MRRETRDAAAAVAIAVVAMLAVPLAYRVWVAYNPPPPPKTLSEVFSLPAAERAQRLLVTPIADWTERDRAAEPRLLAWLEARRAVVLPWEWSEIAREKDSAGYMRAWRDLFADCEGALARAVKAADSSLAAMRRDIETHARTFANATGECARIRAELTTNALPHTVTVRSVSRGRLWGWNIREERREVVSVKEAEALVDSLCDLAAQERRSMEDMEARARVLDAERRRMAALRGDFASLVAAQEVPVNVLLRLVTAINAL